MANQPRKQVMNTDYSYPRRHFLRTLTGVGALLFGIGGASRFAYATKNSNPGARQLAERYGAVTRYEITRKGKKIGNHEVRFSRNGDRLNVSVESRIRVTMLKIPVYTFHYVCEEIWTDDQLISVTGTTTENQTVTKVSMSNDDTGSHLIRAAEPKSVDRLHFASNHWNANVIGSQRIFNTITGKENVIAMQSMGEEQIKTGRGVIATDHYRIAGEIQADVWYDKNLVWSRLAFKGKDGSEIDYLIE